LRPLYDLAVAPRVLRQRATAVPAPSDEEIDQEIEERQDQLNDATLDSAGRLYRDASDYVLFWVILSVLGYIGCVVLAVKGGDAGKAVAVGAALSITASLLVVRLVGRVAKTYALDVQRRVFRESE
jgi:hypothetical protein